VAIVALVAAMFCVAGTSGAGAATPTRSPSASQCAQAFDRPANVALRLRLAPATHAEIFATTVPSCVVKFALAGHRVLAATATWVPLTDLHWTTAVTHGGQVVGNGVSWSHGHLTARGANANITYTLGPAPTVASCVDAWNAAPPTLPSGVAAATPVAVAALNGGIAFARVAGHASIPGNVCTISVERPGKRQLLLAGAWTQGRTTHWLAPISMGLIPGTVPNAKLRRDGGLRQIPPPSYPVVPVSPAASTPLITRVIGASGWAGGVRLHETLEQAIERFGSPTSTVPQGFGCAVSWASLGLSATFAFGGRAGMLCGASQVARSFTGTETWATTTGLRVGMPASTIAQRYPGATHIAGDGGTTIWHLVPRSGRSAQGGLTATTSALGSIVSISIGGAGSTTYGADVSSGTVVWGKPGP
jgi:hypothetical protein